MSHNSTISPFKMKNENETVTNVSVRVKNDKELYELEL